MEGLETKAEVEMGAAAPSEQQHHHHAIRFVAGQEGDDGDGNHALPPPVVIAVHRRPSIASSSASSHARGRYQRSHSQRPPKLLPEFSRPPELDLPPGVAPVDEFLSLFCTVSAVGLTLLATGIPLQVAIGFDWAVWWGVSCRLV